MISIRVSSESAWNHCATVFMPGKAAVMSTMIHQPNLMCQETGTIGLLAATCWGSQPQVRMPGLLSKERTVAGPDFNRWLVPPAALAIHLSIGMAYGFSVFWLPLSRAVGITQPVTCPPSMGFFARIGATTCDWKVSTL